MSDRHRHFVVADGEAGERIDRLLSLHYHDVSRSRFKELVKSGAVNIDGATVIEPNHRVVTGAQIEITIPEPQDAVPQAEDIALKIVHEDDDVIVIDKPAGLVVHPAAGNWTGTLVNALIAHCGASLSGIGGVRRPGIVHRLDKDTTGLLVIAKSDRAHRGLSEQFAAHGRDGRLVRTYRALVWGAPQRATGRIDAALGRHQTARQKMSVVRQGGKEAITNYALEERYVDTSGEPVASLVACTLETGRTHQIRVHMAHIGHPLLGDGVYGAGFAASATKLPDSAQKALEILRRQALHAAILGFEHPISGEKLRFESDLPADLAQLVDACREGLKIVAHDRYI